MASQTEDLTSVQWRSVEWVMAFGALTPTSVMEYFAQSPFYDPTSNNAVLRMQTQYSMDAASGFNEAEELKRFVGVEFAVSYSQPPDLFVIEKRERTSPVEAKTIAVYYVLHNSIYQAPDLYSVLSNRLLSSLYYMQTTLSAAREKKTDFTPRTGGNRYKVVKASEEAQDSVKSEAGDDAEQGGDKLLGEDAESKAAKPASAANKSTKQNMDFVLARALQTTISNNL